MAIKLTPIAAAMVLLLAGQAYADGGAAGANGAGSMIRNENAGSAGLNGAIADGTDGASFIDPDTINTAPSGTPGAGKDGETKTDAEGGGGAGGNGGGSVFGGISTGGAAGSSNSSANGGNGGNVSAKIIEITNSTLTGTTAGAGGSVTSSPNTAAAFGGGGAAGHGGGSVFGGISTGGAGGYGTSISITTAANGGHGGDVTDNKITLMDVELDARGATAGAGGNVASASHSSYGGGGAAGHGGGSVFGGISTGGAAGRAEIRSTSLISSVRGGHGGNVSANMIEIINSTLTGGAAGAGGNVTSTSGQYYGYSFGGGGAAGHGGGSVFGGISIGGAGGSSASSYLATFTFTSESGGNGGDVSENTIEITNSILTGAAAGAGGSGTYSVAPSNSSSGGGGAAGHGGGSVFGGISTGGAAGTVAASSANGGHGGNVSANTIEITNSTLNGAAAGAGGSVTSNADPVSSSSGGGGAAGHGGGSVFGGISTGGAAGKTVTFPEASTNGGRGGNVSANTIKITNSTLTGAAAGAGGSVTSSTDDPSSFGGGGAGGHGGGSVFGGISTGGAGGYGTSISTTTSANGGDGGGVSANTIEISNSTLRGAAAGAGGSVSSSAASSYGGGAAGHDGGSVFGGISTGGAAGYAESFSSTITSANGGNGGDVTDNKITISGVSKISGDIYGGISQGGAKGKTKVSSTVADGVDGQGGWVQNNTITLIGKDITIGGSIYGGRSINGGGIDDHTKAFTGNILNLEGYKGSVQGIYNIEKFNWLLPKDVVNGFTMVSIAGNTAVQLDRTKHTAAMYNDGNQLNAGYQIVLIDKVVGEGTLTTPKIHQGLFLVYDAELETVGDDLVLKIKGKEDTTPVTPEPPKENPNPAPAGKLHPAAKAFLGGRLATLATLNQGADTVGADTAKETCRTNVFVTVNGGSNRYKTTSDLKVNDYALTLGTAKCLELASKSEVMLGTFIQHGNSNFDGHNNFVDYGDTKSWGKVSYTGAGVLLHMNVAGTGSMKDRAASMGDKDGLYLNASFSGGRTTTHFYSDLYDAQRVQGAYSSKASYISAMAGVGYGWKFDDQQLVDVYGRYSWSKLGSDSVTIGKDALSFGSLKSSRVRVGARYSYAANNLVKPYVGVAYEREFKGNATGMAYGMSIEQETLKGGSGVFEFGVAMKPSQTNKAWTVNAGLQGYIGQRKGISAGVKARYEF